MDVLTCSAAGDRVLLRYRDKDPQLTASLARGSVTSNHLGVFKHEDILGKRAGESVRSHNGRRMQIKIPSLAEYITLTPRMVTPVSGTKVW